MSVRLVLAVAGACALAAPAAASTSKVLGSDQRRFDALNWNTHFTFFAALKQRSSGYDLTIRRVVLQRISRSARQLCVIASLEKPRKGSPVVVRQYFSAHAVALSSGRFRVSDYQYAFPTAG